jgi:TonB family protein
MTPSLRCLPLLLLVATLAVPAQSAQPKAGSSPVANRDAVPFTQSRPAYPESLHTYRIRGEVRLAYDVDADGYVQNLRAIYATHPDFLKPALEVAKGWRFRPARKDGKPVVSSREESVFSDVLTPGLPPFEIPYVPPKELPDSLRYDRPPSIRTLVPVVYPYEHLLANRRGMAEVALLIAPDGLSRESRVRSATEPAFGYALAAAMEAWEFEPAMRNGQPAGALLARGQEFTIDGEDRLVSEGTRRLLRILSSESPSIIDVAALDAVPQHIDRIVPVFPQKHVGKDGSTEIEFIIDREGTVHLPRIVSASEPEFGWAAATAVQRWKFEPPRKEGEPVDARVRLQLDFRGSVAPAATSASSDESPPSPADAPAPAEPPTLPPSA